MKFNRLQLIERLRKNIKANQTEYERKLAAWDSVLEEWNRGAAFQQFTAMKDFSTKLQEAVGQVQNMDRPLTGEELPKVPNISRSSWSNQPLEVPVPSEIKGIRCPEKHQYNVIKVEAFVFALELMLDDEVSSSGIESLGHRETLRQWL